MTAAVPACVAATAWYCSAQHTSSVFLRSHGSVCCLCLLLACLHDNFHPYEGDGSFLEGPTDATKAPWAQLQELTASVSACKDCSAQHAGPVFLCLWFLCVISVLAGQLPPPMRATAPS
jgi:hypothetical protein